MEQNRDLRYISTHQQSVQQNEQGNSKGKKSLTGNGAETTGKHV